MWNGIIKVFRCEDHVLIYCENVTPQINAALAYTGIMEKEGVLLT